MQWIANISVTTWILWLEMALSFNMTDPHWRVEQAFQTQPLCESARDQRFLDVLAGPAAKGGKILWSRGPEHPVRVQMPGGDIVQYRFICLPDIVDPRRPKPRP